MRFLKFRQYRMSDLDDSSNKNTHEPGPSVLALLRFSSTLEPEDYYVVKKFCHAVTVCVNSKTKARHTKPKSVTNKT
jgi:hypothetical protein